MGKAKRNRAKAPRHNPTGVTSVRDAEESELNGAVGSRPNKSGTLVQTVTEQLQSQDSEEKLRGLYLLAEVFDGQTLSEVGQNKIVRIAGPLLTDTNTTVRNTAAGALRNLSANGGPEFCDLLVEQDLMTPLCTLLHKFGDSWQPKVSGTSDNDENADTFIQAVNLLWNLCESSATALKYFNQSQLLLVLLRCLDVKSFGIDVALAVAECLHTVTEDNAVASTKMQEVSAQLQQFLSASGDAIDMVLLKVLIAGILLNISQDGISSVDPSILALIMTALSDALSLDHRQEMNHLTSDLKMDIKQRSLKIKKHKVQEDSDEDMETEEIAEEKPDKQSKRNVNKDKEHSFDKLNKESKIITNAHRLLQAQQVALEILANMCSGEDDDEDMDADASESEEMSDTSLGDDSGPQEKIPVNVSSDVLEAVVSLSLLPKVWDRTKRPAENVCEILHEHVDCQQVVKRLNLLRSRAFLCLQNIVSVMDLEELGGCNDLYNMWLETTKLVFHDTKTENIVLLEAATSLMRAAVQRLAQAKAPQFASLNINDLQMLLRGEQQSKDANVRANLIRIVGSIGQLLVPLNSPHLQVIGKFLLDAASRDAELWVTAEALDCIFDVFGEDETDKVAFDIGLVDKLRLLVATLKSKVRMQRKSLGDHYHIVMTASTNLSRFIKYKEKRLMALTSNGHH